MEQPPKKNGNGDKVKGVLANVLYWRLAIARVMIYMSLTMLTTFLGLTEKLADGDWTALGLFSKSRMAMLCFVSGGTVLIAFLDSTLSALREQAKYEQAKPGEKPPVASSETGHTQFIKKS